MYNDQKVSTMKYLKGPAMVVPVVVLLSGMASCDQIGLEQVQNVTENSTKELHIKACKDQLWANKVFNSGIREKFTEEAATEFVMNMQIGKTACNPLFIGNQTDYANVAAALEKQNTLLDEFRGTEDKVW